METFTYSFALSLLHSTWQAAALLLAYTFIVKTIRNPHPLFKRNLLFTILALQAVASIASFIFYYAGSTSYASGNFTLLTDIIPPNSSIAHYADYIFYAYSTIITYKTALLVYQYLSFNSKFRQDRIKPAVEIKLFTANKAYHFGIRRKVAIWYSERVSSPLTFGFLKPVILMPVALMNQLSIAETEALIVHELTHIKYNDYFLNWLLIISETVYFFNPFIRLIAGKIKMEREKNCDAQVMQFSYSPVIYAEALFKTAAHNLDGSRFQLAAVKNKSELLQRIRFFSNNDRLHFSKGKRGIVPVILLSLLLLGNLMITAKFIPVTIHAAMVSPGNIESTTQSFVAIDTAFYPSGFSNDKAIAASALDEKSSQLKVEQNTVDLERTAAAVPVDQESIRAEDFPVIPVALTTEPAAISREVVVSEENSDGKTIKTVYRLTLQNGEWITEPIYMIGEIKAAKDTLQKLMDSVSKQLPIIVE